MILKDLLWRLKVFYFLVYDDFEKMTYVVLWY
jgi:hypothetical protein